MRWIGSSMLAMATACSVPPELPAGYLDDASRLNATRVEEIADLPSDPVAAEEQLRALLERARIERRRVSIAGARHSMGGHTLYPGGIVLNMLPFNHLELDEQREVLTVGAGARWSEIIPYLDAHGRSVAVMQSNNDFTVGGSVSVNAHGWQQNRPPIASTVDSLRVMLADGTVVRASRTENRQLFSLVLGGYGLFGVILDVELRVVPNERYHLVRTVVPLERFVSEYRAQVGTRPDVGMVHGRLSIVPDNLFGEAVLSVFRRAPAADGSLPALREPAMSSLRRRVFRSSQGSDLGKKLRWRLERGLGESLSAEFFSRNQLLNEGAAVYEERSAARTDILHEYFVPVRHFETYLRRTAEVVTRCDGDLLNVTVRHVLADPDTFLRYAGEEMFAFVMLFSQERTPEGEACMEAMTRELVDIALESEGTYYLPYRLHASAGQLAAAYPMAREFFELKRRYDPTEMFQSRFYQRYGTAGE
jgi:FAD/FMN-containing dehydrogenase